MAALKAGVETEEKFKKNKVSCSFATADGMCTLGFSESKKAGTKLFDEIVLGNVETIQKYREKIQQLLSEELLKD